MLVFPFVFYYNIFNNGNNNLKNRNVIRSNPMEKLVVLIIILVAVLSTPLTLKKL